MLLGVALAGIALRGRLFAGSHASHGSAARLGAAVSFGTNPFSSPDPRRWHFRATE